MSRTAPSTRALSTPDATGIAAPHCATTGPKEPAPGRPDDLQSNVASAPSSAGALSSDHAGLAAARDHAILAAALDPIITIDAFGTIHSASDSVHRVFGWTPQELMGRDICMLMSEPDCFSHTRHLADFRLSGQASIIGRTREVQAVRKSGEIFPIELCVSRVDAAPEGSATLLVGIIRDITQRKELEKTVEDHQRLLEQKVQERTEALQQSQDRLHLADRLASIGTLAAGLGHDMNNVLLPVRARLDALKAAVHTGHIPGTHKRHIDEIRKSIAYLQQLADGLHYLAMDPDVEAGSRGEGSVTDLAKWWSHAGTLLSKAGPRHVRVIAAIPADLPMAALPAHGLTQAILNLVVNAGEAIPGPSVRKRRQGLVRIWANPVEVSGRTWIHIGVSDNGTGMSEDVRRRALEMFFTTKSRGLGTGLGLALVRKVAERCGGRVEIESEVGKGTTVTMIIPAALSAEQSRAAGNARSAAITLKDGRAAAIIQHVLEVSGATVRSDADPARANVWVVDSTLAVRKATLWREAHPAGKLVVVGKPDARAAAKWRELTPISIDKPDDLTDIRAAIGHALATDGIGGKAHAHTVS